MIICEECGNDLATEGYRYCLDCLEALSAEGFEIVPARVDSEDAA